MYQLCSQGQLVFCSAGNNCGVVDGYALSVIEFNPERQGAEKHASFHASLHVSNCMCPLLRAVSHAKSRPSPIARWMHKI